MCIFEIYNGQPKQMTHIAINQTQQHKQQHITTATTIKQHKHIVCICVCIYVCIYIYMYIYIYTHVYMCMYVYIYIYVCMYVCLFI